MTENPNRCCAFYVSCYLTLLSQQKALTLAVHQNTKKDKIEIRWFIPSLPFIRLNDAKT